jgi:hypothetical protein
MKKINSTPSHTKYIFKSRVLKKNGPYKRAIRALFEERNGKTPVKTFPLKKEDKLH